MRWLAFLRPSPAWTAERTQLVAQIDLLRDLLGAERARVDALLAPAATAAPTPTDLPLFPAVVANAIGARAVGKLHRRALRAWADQQLSEGLGADAVAGLILDGAADRAADIAIDEV